MFENKGFFIHDTSRKTRLLYSVLKQFNGFCAVFTFVNLESESNELSILVMETARVKLVAVQDKMAISQRKLMYFHFI